MALKIFLEKINQFFSKFKEDSEQESYTPAYRIVEIRQEDDLYTVKVQMINKSMIFNAKPEDLLAKDEIVDQFSPRDIRTLTYLGYLDIHSPKYKILAKRFIENDNRLVFVIKKKGEKNVIVKTINEIRKEKAIIENLSSKDAQLVGFAIASESTSDEKNQKSLSINIIGKEYDLCLLSEINENGPQPNKVYLAIENEQIKYRTQFTPNNELIALEENSTNPAEELYRGIFEKNLENVSQLRKEALLSEIIKRGHILAKSKEQI